MKPYILIVSFVVGFLTSGYSQSNQNVSFIHGLGESSSIWNTMANQLAQEFKFNRDDVTYNSNNAVSGSASRVYIPSGTVSVGHSLGGLLAREYLRQRGTDRMKALITVGTPHLGAPVAESVQDGRVAIMIGGWIEDLIAGPAAEAREKIDNKFAKDILADLGWVKEGSARLIHSLLLRRFADKPSVKDLKPSSSFLKTLNASPDNTLPAARYSIFGSEDDYEYVRIAESAKNGSDNPMESEIFLRYHHFISTLYFLATARHTYLSGLYSYLYSHSDFTDPEYFTYYNKALASAYIARQYLRGFASLVYFQQLDWDQQIIGVNYYSRDGEILKDSNDGLLSARTQAPLFFGIPGSQILRAEGANHLEETVHPSVKARISEAFLNPDVNISEVQNSGGGGNGDIDPPPPPPPCYDRSGHKKLIPCNY